MTEEKIQEFIGSIETTLDDHSFIKLSLGNYHGTEPELKNIYVRRAVIKKEDKLSLTFRYKNRDIIKNYTPADFLVYLQDLLPRDFHIATLQSSGYEHQFEILKNGKSVLRKKDIVSREVPAPEHDHNKTRLIVPEGKPYLQALRITNEDGHVLKNAQDKYRQINHYIELLSPLIREIPEDKPLHVADMGSGKGYLTFALYDYLHHVLHREATVTGVEFRQELVDLCNKIAGESGFGSLVFRQGTIGEYQDQSINILIALHACDTATDDAIQKGIAAGAELIVVAPCCHKQIRRQMEKQKPDNEVQLLTRYGVFMERQAEMVTDGIRALILEYFGYKTKVFEFISDAHTPKNVMIVGTKEPGQVALKTEVLEKIRQMKAYFGIENHYLETIAGI